MARRAIILYSVVAAAFGADRDDIVEWLEEENLAEELTPDERTFLLSANPSEKSVINFSWHSERLIVLLWALGLCDMPKPDEQASGEAAQTELPPDAEIEVGEFIASARLRPEDELHRMAETLYQLHWEARDASLNDRRPKVRVDLGIIQERHHAINWLLGYDGLDWDDVTTDT